MVRRLIYKIESKDEGVTVREFLLDREYSPRLIAALKRTTKGIKLNGVHVYANEILKAGDVLEISMFETEEDDGIVPVKHDIQILFEDEDILVLNKPADMPIHPSMKHYYNTLANAVAYYFKEKGEAHVFRCINRLDRDTTGATIIAKNQLSASILSNQVKDRKIHRKYVALVEGVVEETGVVDLPIGRKEGSIIERQVDLENGKRAVTHFWRKDVLRVEDKDVSMLELKLETGRTHQIRVHMTHVGHPLLGDFLYNEKNTLMKRQALHSAMLSFHHPITGEEMVIEAPLPEDMKEILEL